MIFALVVWLPLCFVVAYAASQKGRSGVGFFFLSLFFSPLIGLLVLIAVPARASAQAPSPNFQNVPAGPDSSASSAFANLFKVGGAIVGVLAAGYCAFSGPSSTSSPSEASKWGTTTTATVATPPLTTTPPPSSVPNRPLASNAEILEAQRHLYELGYDPGPLDGASGPQTIAAVKRYEKSKGLEEKGALDIRLLENLRHVRQVARATMPPSTVTTSRPTSDTTSEEMRVATRAIREAEHPCPSVLAAQRVSDGSIRASCSNGEVYRIMRLRGELVALKCSAAERMGVSGC